MTPEQLLAIADEFCPIYKVRIRSFPALVACAAVTTGRLHGVAVCSSPATRASSLHDAILSLSPLTSENTAFAAVARDIYLRWSEDTGRP